MKAKIERLPSDLLARAQEPLIPTDHSIIPAADVNTLEELANLTKAVQGVGGVYALKTGITLAYRGLPRAVRQIKDIAYPGNLLVIHDGQKAGTDIPDLGSEYADLMLEAGVDAAIIFPFGGSATQVKWTTELLKRGIQVITGGIMTQPGFLVSEGGYIEDKAALDIYRNAVEMGCRHFVAPGTKPDKFELVANLIRQMLGNDPFSIYSPGYEVQGGKIAIAAKLAGRRFHPIVGRGIYAKKVIGDMRSSAISLVGVLNETYALAA